MLVDWFTVGAQTLNFLILVWLLKRFLYRPILDAIDTREKKIAATLASADTQKAEALKERDNYVRINTAFEQQRAVLMQDSIEEAKKAGQALMDEARQSADDLSVKRRSALQQEQQAIRADISRMTREEVFAISRKVLRDLAGIELETRMVEVFTNRLAALDEPLKTTFTDALTHNHTQNISHDSVIVRSTFELTEEQKGAIQEILHKLIPDANKPSDLSIRFETTPALISGIEMVANGRKIAWSIADYVDTLEKNVSALWTDTSDAEMSTHTVDAMSGSQVSEHQVTGSQVSENLEPENHTSGKSQ
jgi:F-type H+-transporting ATPase subunit b